MVKNKWLFIVGCQRCATTSLLNFMASCEGAYTPFPARPERKMLLNDSWRDDVVSHGKAGVVNIDKATSYIEYPRVSSLISSNFENHKILILVRNPIDRAISNYYFSFENGLEKRPIEEALFSRSENAYDSISVNPYDYIKRGMYVDYIEKFVSCISDKNFKILIAEKFFIDKSYRNEISCWAGLDVTKDVFPHKNSSIEKLASGDSDLRSRLSKVFHKKNLELAEKFNLDLAVWYE